MLNLKRRDRRGAALPATLIVMSVVTALTGWLVAHVVWAGRLQSDEQAGAALDLAADAMALLAVQRLRLEGDWAAVLAAGATMPCVDAAVVPPAAERDLETWRVQAASDALARWPAGQRPQWRGWLACRADALLGGWRGGMPPPWTMALVGDDPDGALIDGAPAQIVVVAVAWSPLRGRAQRIATARRHAVGVQPRIVGWRGG